MMDGWTDFFSSVRDSQELRSNVKKRKERNVCDRDWSHCMNESSLGKILKFLQATRQRKMGEIAQTTGQQSNIN